MQKAKKKAVKKTVKRTSARAKRAAVATVLVLRTCAPDMTARGGFKWPSKGQVSCPDWSKAAVCGNGLHGLLWGEGEGGHLNFSEGAKWLVVAVPANTIVDLRGKVKFPAGKVVFCGDRLGATSYITERHPGGSIAGAMITAGNRGTATAGERGTATAGNRGTATAGEGGTATAGERGTATAGEGGTATAGERGTATAGERGTATAGYGGTATAGDYGTATAGERGTATAGDYGRLEIVYYDSKAERRRKALAYVGEDGIKAQTKYKLDEAGKFVEVKP